MPDNSSPWKILSLPLDVGDKRYEVQPAPYEVGLSMLEAIAKGDEDTRGVAELFAEMMGATWDEMRDDKVPYHIMFHAGLAALQFQTALVVIGLSSEDAVKSALEMWNKAPTPEGVAASLRAAGTAADESPKPARKRPAKKAARRSTTSSTSSNSSASARGTRSRGSTSPTTSRKSTQPPK